MEQEPTAYPPHLCHDAVIQHGSYCTDDNSSERGFGDVVEGRHEVRQGKQHNYTCKNTQTDGESLLNFSFLNYGRRTNSVRRQRKHSTLKYTCDDFFVAPEDLKLKNK